MAPKIQLDLSSLDRRRLFVIAGSVLVTLAAIVGLILFLRSGGDQEKTADALPLSATPTFSPSPTPSPSSPPTPTSTPVLTATLEPYQWIVQPGDTLYYIIQQFGYRDTGIVPEILRLNNMASENDLIAGQVLLIPRQTPTPGPTPTAKPTIDQLTGESETGATPDYTGCSPENRCVSPDGQYWIHEVQPGDTINGIAWVYTSRVADILQVNGLPSEPMIFPGQQIKVPILVTLTPTLTPTGGPDSTATPTPTPSPPSLLFPLNGVSFPRHRSVVLQWVAIQPLQGNQHYLVVVHNLDTDDEVRATTRSNAYRLSGDLQPGPGRSVQFKWWVVIVNGNTPTSPVISGQGVAWTFTWGS